jgi:hypothetical protein
MPISLPFLLLAVSILSIHPTHIIPFLWLGIYFCVTVDAVSLSAYSDTAWDVGERAEAAGRVGRHSWLTAWDRGAKAERLH